MNTVYKPTRFARIAAAAAMALLPIAARAAGPNGDAPPNEPEAERQSFKVADGFEVTLFASEPMLMKPIGMNFDSRGRLWVASSQTYPQVKPGDTPNDKIYVLEDTNGDGKADKSTVFAEGLFLPTSVEVGDGGAYVANSTELVHLKDTDGDGKADQKRVVLSGFGTEDTHHIIHGFRWDYGGRLNFLQGIYIGSRVETPRGTKVGLASTLWQLRPDSMDLTKYCQGLVNPWGVTWDRYGQMYLTDGAGGEGVNFAPPGAQFTAADGATRFLKGLNPGSPKYCGAEIVDGRHLPDDWQGDLITNDFRANRTVRFKLTPDGSGVSAKIMPDVITSTDRAYRPVDVKMGPDGAIYIADWYNPIIQHGEVDFRDARRDKAHGRIWRLSAKGRPAVKQPKIDGASVAELLDLLKAPEQWTRLQAKQALKAKGEKGVTAPMRKWLQALESEKGSAADAAWLEALWTAETLDLVDPALLRKVMAAPTPEVRAAAVRVLSHWSATIGPDQTRGAAAKLVVDDSPRVRLEAVRALAMIAGDDPAVVPLVMRATDKPMDPVLDFALFQVLDTLKDKWVPLATDEKLKFDKPEHLAAALKVVMSGEAVKRVVADLKSGKTPVEKRGEAFDVVAAMGAPSDLAVVLAQAADAKVPATVRQAALASLEKAFRQRKARPEGAIEPVVSGVIDDPSPTLQAGAARLAGLYKIAAAAPTLQARLTNDDTAPAVRLAAAQSLADLGGPSRKTVAEYAKANPKPAVRTAAIAGLASVDIKAAAPLAGEWLVAAKPTDDPAPVLAAFLTRQGGVDALAAALKGKTLPADTAKLSLRYVQGVGVELGQLGEVIRASAGAGAGGPVTLSPEEMKKTVDEVLAKGDAARGEAVYLSAAAACTQCHMIGGVGGPLAPDLRAIGATSPVDYLVDSILAPNKAVKDGYSATSVSMKDGDLIQGIKVREDAKELVLRDNARDEIPIPLSEIKSRKEAGSLMPVGLQDGMTRQEFVDLVKFLSELGKPGPYAVPTGQVVRRWKVLPATAADAGKLPPADAAWAPTYGRVNGDLVNPRPAEGQVGTFVRFEFVAADAGDVQLKLNSVAALKAWLDEKPLPLPGQDVPVTVAKGTHAVTLLVNDAARETLGSSAASKALHVEVVEVPGSKARPTVVGGR